MEQYSLSPFGGNSFVFHGLLYDGSNRVRVVVPDLNYFLQNQGRVFGQRRLDNRWGPLEEFDRSDIQFDHCNSIRDEQEV